MIIAGQSGSNRKNLSKAKKLDFICKREDTFNISFDVYYVDQYGLEQAYDFTGCNLKMHVKKRATDKMAILYMPVAVSGNTITLFQTAENMSLDAGNYVYDIELYDMDGDNITILYGSFRILQDVTHFQSVIKEYYNITFTNQIEYIWGKVLDSTITFNNAISYLMGLAANESIGLTNSITYSILEWAIMNSEVILNNSIEYTETIVFSTSEAILTNNYIYFIEEYD